MFEQARQFLTTVLPQPGPENYLNIHWSGRTDDGGKFWDGRAHETVDQAIKTLQWISKQDDKDLYVCMSAQNAFEEKTSKAGNHYRKAIRFAENATGIKSFYIDVDVKDKGYPDTKTALQEFKRFIREVSLPIPSAVVMSGGGGFHAHWALTEALPYQQWQPLAEALAEATRTHHLKTDAGCTIDAARILRIPDTRNTKYGEPRPVELYSLGTTYPLEAISGPLAPFLGVRGANGTYPEGLFEQTPGELPAKVTGVAAKPAQAKGLNDDLSANLHNGAVDIKVNDVARKCPAIANALASGGKDASQPVWFLTGVLSSFLDDGREMFHLMSKGHPNYTKVETNKLYDRIEHQRVKRNTGWPKCRTFAVSGCKECENCPLLKQDKSPLNFASDRAQITVDASLPPQYVRDATGVVSIKHIDDDGTQTTVPIMHYPITDGWLSNSPWTFHFTTRLEKNRKVTIEVPCEIIFARDGFGKYVGSKGLFLSTESYAALKGLCVSWMQKLQTMRDRVISAAPFGWSVVDGNVEGFAYDGRVFMQDGERPAANPDPALVAQYTPRGNNAPWQELAKIVYEQDRPGLNAILAVAFAAPLVKFTGFPGLVLNAFSPESGIGKTTAMKVAQSVWGHPVLAMQGLNDTANSVLGKTGLIRSLPMFWDEIKSEAQIKRFCSIVFELTGGREKTRMSSDAKLKLSGTWQTMLVSASNDSIVDGMAGEAGSTTAGLHRLFEFNVPKPASVTHDVAMVQRLTGKLEDNYGHAGLAYAKFLGANHKRIDQEIGDMQSAIGAEIDIKQEERMWAATIAVLLKGAEYANELNLLKIDVDELKAFLLSVLSRMRGEVDTSPTSMNTEMSVSSILAEFLNSTRARNTLVTDRIWVAPGKPPKGAIKIKNDTTRLGDICVQVGQDDGMIRISSTFFSRWMGERNYSRKTYLDKLNREFGVKIVNGRIGSGTGLIGSTEYLLELDCNHPALSKFVQD